MDDVIPFAGSDGGRPLGDRPHLTGTIDTDLREIASVEGTQTAFALQQQIHFWATERKCAAENLRQAENARDASFRSYSLAQARGDERACDAWLARAAHHLRRIRDHIAWIDRCDRQINDVHRRLAALDSPSEQPSQAEITLPLLTAAE